MKIGYQNHQSIEGAFMTEEEQAKLDAAKDALKERNDERLARMEAIADSNDASRDADEAAMGIKDDSEERERAAAEEDARAAEVIAKGLQEEGAAPDSDTKTVNGEVYYRQIVNGQEKWQTLKDIRTTASKVESGDEYLRQASEAVKNASRLALSKKDEPVSLEEDQIADLHRRSAMGDEDAIKTLASWQAGLSRQLRDVPMQIDQRSSFRTELASLEAKSKDLLENPYMGRLFRDRLNEMKAENPTMGLSEAYTSIDTELRTAFPQVTKHTAQDKLERKRTLVNVPTTAARQPAEGEPEREDDYGSAIADLAKSRQPRPNPYASRRN